MTSISNLEENNDDNEDVEGKDNARLGKLTLLA